MLFIYFAVNLAAETNRVKGERAGLEPIELAPDIKVEPTPIYSQVDQKAKLYTKYSKHGRAVGR